MNTQKINKMNFFQMDHLNLINGLVIPPFVNADPNLDVEFVFHLSGFLGIFQSKGIFEIRQESCDCGSGVNCYWDELVNEFERMFYINLLSRKVTKRKIKYKIEIHPWYLRYIDMNPFYFEYQVEYFQFLKDIVIPELTDDKIKEKLINTILDNSN